ncbi:MULTISPECIES: TIGR02921 family PEP-CTERM protein [Spirulina sp. CCY15215]|uniref:TIGR02921 family PEP-CTERM protein n=1 Tax=Spirulina sp. CCY15215 TaxID=2767591 RepID=UPI00194FE4F7|nr:TIGR02921 family PEP-CTERM protein [Spirulina major]
MNRLNRLKRYFSFFPYAIFGIWNIAFILVIYVGILPNIGISLMQAVAAGEIHWQFLVTFLGFIAVITNCTFLGGWYFFKRPYSLLQFFYGIEAPFFLLCIVRLFALRELNPASSHILTTLLWGIFAFFLYLIGGYLGKKERISQPRRHIFAFYQLISHSLLIIIGVYTALLLLFYAVPIAWWLLKGFFAFQWLGELFSALTDPTFYGYFWVFIILFLVFIFGSTLFIFMPFAFALFYISAGRKVLSEFAEQYGHKIAIAGATGTIAVWLTLFFSLQQQPQNQALEWLAEMPTTNSDRTTLIAKSDQIREGLVNAYLLPYRYISTWEENNHIQEMYRGSFNLSIEKANILQQLYNQLASPVLYQGDRSDVGLAETLYSQFFDTPIQNGDRQAIVKALTSTANRAEAKAGLLDIEEKKVLLTTQEINLSEHQDWAEIELHEVYENQTPEQQEIFYSFSLPESAVLTGLWLGETGDRDSRYVYQVSPRGAAQQVYNDQVQQRVDPALLEQVGPRQYRLRAFPILANQVVNGKLEAPEMHLWLTYQVLQQKEGWALPQLAQKRNIFWTNKTKRFLNAEKQRGSKTWLPAFLPSSNPVPLQPHNIDFSQGYQLIATPLDESKYSTPKGTKIAVLVDTSYSMGERVQEIAKSLEWLTNAGFSGNKKADNDADLYLTGTLNLEPQRIDDLDRVNLANLVFYGTIQPPEMLQQFQRLQGTTQYDAILLLTDEGTYELSEDDAEVPEIDIPLWMVHLGGKFPPAYADRVLSTLQDSGGGVAVELSEVLQRLATRATLNAVNVIDRYVWKVEKSDRQNEKKDGFSSIAARQLIVGLGQQLDTQQVANLDILHDIAKTNSVVTPYSSMIVLVNDQQKEQLKQAEAKSDRFEREVESGKEELTSPFNPFEVSAVPEPELWVLLGLGAIGLLLVIWQRRRVLVEE